MSKTNNPADLKAGDLEHVLTSCRVSPNLIFTIQESKLIRPSDEDEDEDHRIVALGDTQVCPQHDSAGESSSCILDHNGVFCGESGQGASAPVCRAVLASEAVHVGCTVDVGDSIDLGGYDVVHHDTTRLEARGGKMFLRPIGRKTSMRLYAFEDLATGLVAAIEARVLNRLVSAVPCCPDMYDHDDPRRGFIEAHGYAPSLALRIGSTTGTHTSTVIIT